MSLARKVGLVVLALLLITTTATANIVMTSERTVLNANFVDQSLEEEDGYSQLRAQTVTTVTDRIEEEDLTGSEQIPASLQSTVNITDLVSDAITESYVRNQSRANLFRLYDYLHGERSDLALSIDLRPLKDNLGDEINEEVRDINISTLVDEFAPPPSQIPIEISGDRVRRMRANQSGYQAVREEFRQELRDIAIDRIVDSAFEEASTDNLLREIGEDPDQYTEAEKQQIVNEREDEIRSQLRQRIIENDDGAVREEINTQLQQRAQTAKEQARETTQDATSQYSDTVTNAAIDLQFAVIDGLATNTSYENFSTRLDTAETTLADEASRLAVEQLEQEVPDNISLTEELTEQDRESLSMTSNRVQQLDTLNSVLPLVALLLIVLMYLLTRSIGTTAFTAGTSIGLVGLVSFVGATLISAPIENAISTEIPENEEAIQELAIGLVEQLLGMFSSMSLLLVGIGVVLLLVWVAARRDVF